jgi:hypothetical protein
MKIWPVSIALAGCVLLAGTARADQCQWVDAAVARRAEAILAHKPRVIAFCEPCGEQAPGMPAVARTVSVRTPQDGYREVILDGRGIDLAYTYVQTSEARYRNLAELAGCPADGVSPRLEVAAETPTGILITADPTSAELPAEPRAEPRAEPPAETCPEPPPAPTVTRSPPVVVVRVTAAQPAPSLALLLACVASLFAGALCVMTAALVRRRRTMRPRASELAHPPAHPPHR